jgi:hypothetical protein
VRVPTDKSLWCSDDAQTKITRRCGAAGWGDPVTLFRAIILTDDEESELLALHRSFHASMTDAHNTKEELEGFHRLKAGENRIAAAHGLDPDKLSISFGRDKAGNWHPNATYPLTRDEEERVRGLG